MENQVRIDSKGDQYAIVLVHHGSSQEMDVRKTYSDAEAYAYYLASRMKLDVYYQGKKLTR